MKSEENACFRGVLSPRYEEVVHDLGTFYHTLYHLLTISSVLDLEDIENIETRLRLVVDLQEGAADEELVRIRGLAGHSLEEVVRDARDEATVI